MGFSTLCHHTVLYFEIMASMCLANASCFIRFECLLHYPSIISGKSTVGEGHFGRFVIPLFSVWEDTVSSFSMLIATQGNPESIITLVCRYYCLQMVTASCKIRFPFRGFVQNHSLSWHEKLLPILLLFASLVYFLQGSTAYFPLPWLDFRDNVWFSAHIV